MNNDDCLLCLCAGQEVIAWFRGSYAPDPTSRRYLVMQGDDCWVRHWDGAQWLDPKIEKYGPIRAWTFLPPLPD